MTIYNQHSEPWGEVRLGDGPTMSAAGCLTADHAIAFELAGWTGITPLSVVEAFVANRVYTDSNYVFGPGLIQWYKVSEAFPEYHFHLDASGRFKFVQVTTPGRFEHWLLEDGGNVYDPIDGTQGDAGLYGQRGYRKTGVVRSADIDAPPQGQVTEDVPVHAFPKTVSLTANAYVRSEPRVAKETEISQKMEGNRFDYLTLPFSFVAVDIAHGENVQGNDLWLKTDKGHFIWTGATTYQPN